MADPALLTQARSAVPVARPVAQAPRVAARVPTVPQMTIARSVPAIEAGKVMTIEKPSEWLRTDW